MAHAQLDGVQLYTEVMRFGENPDDIITNIKLLCSESTPSPAANTVSGLAIGDTCAHQPHMFEALRTGHLQHSITEYGLFWLEASAPQCRQGLCLSMAQHTPELSIDEAICGVGDDHNTIADCVKSGSLSETSACTCRCEDERGNRAEANSSLCTCPDNMECVSLSQEYSDYPPELQGGYCVSK